MNDPRHYASPGASHPLVELARAQDGRALADAFRDLAESARDDEIADALAAAPSQPIYAALWQALCSAIEKPAADEGVSARVFAIPWVIVCGASAPAVLTCVLPDAREITRVLEANGVFGASRNLGLGNTLTSIETLERLKPSEALAWSRSPAPRDVPPAEIRLTRGAEEVHARFLLGAAIAPSRLPDIVETGANIGQWGTAAVRAMTKQLAAPGVQVLPMPRPPAGLYTAAYAGRRAALETAFNLFMSNAVRQFRLSVGDPNVTLSAHAGGELRVTLSTPLDEGQVEGFRWPLHPVDDLDEIEATVTGMIAECRLSEPYLAPGVLPDHSSTGAVLFPTH